MRLTVVIVMGYLLDRMRVGVLLLKPKGAQGRNVCVADVSKTFATGVWMLDTALINVQKPRDVLTV